MAAPFKNPESAPYTVTMLPEWSPEMVILLVTGAAELIESLCGKKIADAPELQSVCASLRELASDAV